MLSIVKVHGTEGAQHRKDFRCSQRQSWLSRRNERFLPDSGFRRRVRRLGLQECPNTFWDKDALRREQDTFGRFGECEGRFVRFCETSSFFEPSTTPLKVHERDVDSDLLNLVVKLQMRFLNYRLCVTEG